jgi:hypothetical protein
MYDDNVPAGGADLPELEPRSGIKSWTHKIFSKAETIIPIILIILFLLFFAVSFMDVSANDIPLIGGFLGDIMGDDLTSVLVIGEPMQVTQDMFSRSDFKQKYRFLYKSPENLDRNPYNTIKKYDIIILDQSESSHKAITDSLALAIQSYVKSGGSFIIVADSGYRKIGRPDAFGWIANFGDSIAPIDCQQNKDLTRPCENPIPIQGVIENTDPTNSALEGFTSIPATLTDASSLSFTVYDVNPNGDAEEWATIQDIRGKTYVGVVYKRAGFGEVVYFNYNQVGTTPELLDKILTKLS